MADQNKKTARPLGRLLRQVGGTVLAFSLAALFVSLGEWQLGKARAKEAAQARLDAGQRAAPTTIGATPLADPAALHLQPVRVRGRYDAAGQILIDNRVLHGRAGFHVLTPLVIEGAGEDMRILVNRGWIAAPPTHAARLVVPVPADPVELTGTGLVPPARTFALAPDTAPAGGDAVWQNLDLGHYRAASLHALQPLVILLAPEAAGGLRRDWPRPDDRHERHRAYAYQWFGFAAASIAIWAFFAWRRFRPGAPQALVPVDAAPHHR